MILPCNFKKIVHLKATKKNQTTVAWEPPCGTLQTQPMHSDKEMKAHIGTKTEAHSAPKMEATS